MTMLLLLASALIFPGAKFHSDIPAIGVVPDGYTEVARATGDLNRDGIDDLALIIRSKPKPKLKSSDAAKNDESRDSEIEVLSQDILILKGTKFKTYKLWLHGDRHFIGDDGGYIDPGGFAHIGIKKGVLEVASSVARAMGGWSAGGCLQKWRQHKDSLRLIGLTITDINRTCACGSTHDTNLLTGKEIVTSDRDKNQLQTTETSITKLKKPEFLLFQDFDFEKRCWLE